MTFGDSLSVPWQACLEEAWTACCQGTIPIGACIASTGGQVLARGRNRIVGPAAEPGCISGSKLAHAELNALLAVDLAAPDCQSWTLYTTTEPCPLCLGAF